MLGILMSEEYPSLEGRIWGKQSFALHQIAELFPNQIAIVTPSSMKTFHTNSKRCLIEGWVWESERWIEKQVSLSGIYDRYRSIKGFECYVQWRKNNPLLIPFFNPLSFVQFCFDKWQTEQAFHQHFIPHVKSFEITPTTSENDWKNWLQQHEKVWLKPRRGSHGEQTQTFHVCSSKQQLQGVLDVFSFSEVWEELRLHSTKWLVQPCYGDEEIRIWFFRAMDGCWKIVWARKKRLSSNLPANRTFGTVYQVDQVDWKSFHVEGETNHSETLQEKEIFRLARQVIVMLELLFEKEASQLIEFAVDSLWKDHRWVVLECNSKPGKSVETSKHKDASSIRKELLESPLAYLFQLFLKDRSISS